METGAYNADKSLTESLSRAIREGLNQAITMLSHQDLERQLAGAKILHGITIMLMEGKGQELYDNEIRKKRISEGYLLTARKEIINDVHNFMSLNGYPPRWDVRIQLRDKISEISKRIPK